MGLLETLGLLFVLFACYLRVVSWLFVACQNRRKPLELPEWTGRERKSLRADLEAAAEQWEYESQLTRAWQVRHRVARTHGLFPEALEAYLEKQQ